MRNISRRDFLKGVAATAAVSALTGCTSPAETTTAAPTTAAPVPETTPAAPVVQPEPQIIKMTAQEAMASLNPQDHDYRQNSITDFTKTKLFTSWNFGPLTIGNRMVKSTAGSDTQKSWATTPWEMGEYYSNFARGGVKMVWMEDVFDIYPSYPNPNKPAVGVDAMKLAVEGVHKAGGYIGYQISAMSLPGVTIVGSIADTLTKDQIKAYIDDASTAALNLKNVGFDAVEINAAGNNIGQSFFSRNRNHRDDEYGPQSFENRARFVCEIIQGVKAKCGKDFPVQVLINGIEENDAVLGDNSLYTTVAENKQICKMLEAAGADSLHVRLGPAGQHVCQFASDLYFIAPGIEGTTAYGNQFDFSRHWEGKLIANHSGCGMMLNVAAEIKSAVSIPVGTVTYMDPAHAPDMFEQALQDGKVDFYLMTRPLTVDPEYVNKLYEGRIDEIAPCTRCMHCHFDYDENGKTYEHCRVNACTQRAYRAAMPEGYKPTDAETVKNVMVIGGGPAGMEAARIAASRGHKVTLYEKNSFLGGLLLFAEAIKGPHENLGDLNKYLARQLELTGVTVVTGKEVTADFIKSEAPDAVILAVGGKRPELAVAGTAGTKVISVDDVAREELGEDITILGGNVQAVDVALYLLAQGKHVNIVTNEPLAKLEKGHSNWVKTFIKPMLYARGTRVWPNAKITKVGDGEITVFGETGAETTFACDTIIDASDMLPNTALIEGLGDKAVAVGDCKLPWNIAEAITAGNLAARAL
ncbi:MAG: FAD-dependent oxidoreductase [Lachnospiraceae bacterium]|nr:FAD-dependent oxidoreductase [Lachnospiraceae bacterium]